MYLLTITHSYSKIAQKILNKFRSTIDPSWSLILRLIFYPLDFKSQHKLSPKTCITYSARKARKMIAEYNIACYIKLIQISKGARYFSVEESGFILSSGPLVSGDGLHICFERRQKRGNDGRKGAWPMYTNFYRSTICYFHRLLTGGEQKLRNKWTW